jgi:hypothetical protein
MRCSCVLPFSNLMNDESDIDILLMRSAKLEEVLTEFFDLDPYEDSARMTASRIMCSVVFEHARSIKILTDASGYTSAVSLYRLQYEVLVRAFWLLFAASDEWVSTLMTDITTEGIDKANKLPLVNEMLAALADSKAPEVAVAQLRDFKAQVWKPLCSFVHAGFHALHGHGTGYPPDMISQIIKGSNGLCLITGNLLVMMSFDKAQAGRISGILERFSDCFPDPKHDTP